jgi:dTDP-4-amino-4,6-dideoxygalactose transaminase
MDESSSPIFVTKPFLPELSEFVPYLQRIWDSHYLTNSGPFHQQFEQELARHLGVDHISVFANGTLALLTALEALGIVGEVITTPFSFVATSHVLTWKGLRPIFIDIDPHSFNLDPQKIERAITPETTAILAVHVYGRPCAVDRIAQIAAERNLRVIYDAAHAFDVKYQNRSITAYGDLSALSFHATKVFNTFEGGALISDSAEMKLRIDRIKNFGFVDEISVVETGINGKMNEFQAALGLLQLQHIQEAIAKRKFVHDYYVQALCKCKGIVLPQQMSSVQTNYAYFPILVTDDYDLSRDALYEKLRNHSIFSRRYFYPLISEFPMYRHLPSSQSANLKVAHRIAAQVLCLPISPLLSQQDADRICDLIVGSRA